MIGQILDTLAAHGIKADAYYLRTSDQYELDLILVRGDIVWAVKIMLTSSPSPQDTARLRKTGEMIGSQRNVLVCRIKNKIVGSRDVVVSLRAFLNMIAGTWS